MRLPGPILGLARLLLLTVLQVTAAGSNAQGTAGWPCSRPPPSPSDRSLEVWGGGALLTVMDQSFKEGGVEEVGWGY